ncbi:MAG: hypothetical protein KDA46_12335 [Parvularculaceae bacterium]|nr:hypothetical protein [Parvularculaceae bacterium]
MILINAYETLRDCDLALSQYEFSRDWCGMGRTYLSWAKSANAKPSHKALIRLVFAIDEKLAQLSGDHESEFPEVAAHDCQALSSLRTELISALKLL